MRIVKPGIENDCRHRAKIEIICNESEQKVVVVVRERYKVTRSRAGANKPYFAIQFMPAII